MNDLLFPDPLDDLLRAAAAPPLADDGFTDRTMRAVERTPDPRLAIARALLREQRRWEAQARLWRWAMAGVLAGLVALFAAMLGAPDSSAATAPPPWPELSMLLAAGATWVAWRQLRDD